MTRHWRWIAATLSLAVLAGCNNTPELGRSGTAIAVDSVRQLVSQRQAQATRLEPTPGFPGLDPALVAGAGMPILGAYLESRGLVAGLAIAAQQGGRVTWATADNVAVTLSDDGVLLSSRGLGADLLASDSAQTQALIARGQGGTAQRRHTYLDGVFVPVRVSLTCTVTLDGPEALTLGSRHHATLRFTETCQGDGLSVTNRYWRDQRGSRIRQSMQWIGPQAGTLYLQRLID